MHAELLHPNEFLKAADLRGQDVTLTILHVELEQLTMTGGQKETKPVVHFTEMQKREGVERKRLVLNKTNRRIIQRLYGDETDHWKGKRITLYPTRAKFGRDDVDAIRIRNKKPETK